MRGEADRQGNGTVGKPLCVVAGDDPKLIGHVAASLPLAELAGFVLVAPAALAALVRLPGCRGHVAIEDHAEPGALANALVRAAQGRRLVGLGADDCGTDLLDALSQQLDLAVLDRGSQKARLLLRDKWYFHQLCEAHTVRVPETRCFADKAAIPFEVVLAELGAPLVIKPIDRAGGKGIAVVHNAGEFAELVLANPDYAFAPLLVQRFIAGDDLGLSLIALEGQVRHVCIQVFDGNICHFIEHAEYMAAAERLVAATGFSGLAHFDAQRAPDGSLYLLECNTRPWASISQASWGGLNFVRAAIETALGLAPSQRAFLTQGSSPLVRDWWRSNVGRPWRLLTLTPDQRALALRRPLISRLTG